MHFVDEPKGVELEQEASAADLREFIHRKLGRSAGLKLWQRVKPQILILTGVHDLEANVVGVDLLKRGVDYIRLNSEDLPSRGCIIWTMGGRAYEARLLVGHEEVAAAQISTVWYRHMSLESFGACSDFCDPLSAAFANREWQWALRDFNRSLCCFWVNAPDAVEATADWLLRVRWALDIGLDVPPTIMSNDPIQVREFYDACDGQIIAKVVSLHFLRAKGRLFDFFGRHLRPDDLNLLDDVRYVPCIFQEYIPKGLEVCVTVVGDKVFAAEVQSQVNESSRDDYHRGSLKDIPKAMHHLPSDIEHKCWLLVRRMGLVYGVVDLILTRDGRYIFSEVNASGDWRWIEVETGSGLLTRSLIC